MIQPNLIFLQDVNKFLNFAKNGPKLLGLYYAASRKTISSQGHMEKLWPRFGTKGGFP